MVDFLAKGLPRVIFEEHLSKLDMIDIYGPKLGGVLEVCVESLLGMFVYRNVIVIFV